MTTTFPEPIEHLEQKLDQFRPTQHYLLHSTNPEIIYSPGVKFLAEQTDGFWLIDTIAEQLTSEDTKTAMQNDERLRSLQEWSLTVIHDIGTPEHLEGRAGFLCQPFFEEYRPPHRDNDSFPLDHVRILAVRDDERWLLVLPSEKPDFVSHRNSSEEILQRWQELFR